MTADVLIVIDQQKAMSHPKWGTAQQSGRRAERRPPSGGVAHTQVADYPCKA
jgi:hypothetical protein